MSKYNGKNSKEFNHCIFSQVTRILIVILREHTFQKERETEQKPSVQERVFSVVIAEGIKTSAQKHTLLLEPTLETYANIGNI